MPHRVRRATRVRVQARARSDYVAERIGRALREARLGAGLRQVDIAERAAISQTFVSRIERGRGGTASLATLTACALACGVQLAAFVEALPGAALPRDIEHARRQQAVIDLATRGGWRAIPERPIDPDARRSRSIDVLLERVALREAAVVEIVDLVTDAGETMRSHTDKIHAIRREKGTDWRVAGVLVVRGTSRNRALVRALRDVFAARYQSSSQGWLAAIGKEGTPMPAGDGLLWTAATTPELLPVRVGEAA